MYIIETIKCSKLVQTEKLYSIIIMQLANLFLLIFVIQIYILEAYVPEYEISSFNREGVVFSVGKMNWYAAYGFCTQLGMKLLTLQSSVDIEEFEKMVQHYKLQKRFYWLSASRLEDEVTFRWGLRGPPISFENFSPYQPDNRGGIQRCLRLYKDDKWDDVDCSAMDFFAICHF
ncbi:perlucin-like isoform X5 [Bactrocera dorsalis]|uniref:Perlucin-like isoform X5 n=1 Tax=Bactrocera dorsalis TaxID=27457 RepID=A0ABM3IYP8_BACDO|nr:perlucin-like isoform X5 [Bactrocera dorsalis]